MLTPVAGATHLVHVDLNSFTTGVTQAIGLAPLWTCEGMCSLLLQVRRSWSTLTMPSSLWGPQYSARISPGHTTGALRQASAQAYKVGPLAHKYEPACQSNATLGKAIAFASADSCVRDACSRARRNATSSHA